MVIIGVILPPVLYLALRDVIRDKIEKKREEKWERDQKFVEKKDEDISKNIWEKKEKIALAIKQYKEKSSEDLESYHKDINDKLINIPFEALNLYLDTLQRPLSDNKKEKTQLIVNFIYNNDKYHFDILIITKHSKSCSVNKSISRAITVNIQPRLFPEEYIKNGYYIKYSEIHGEKLFYYRNKSDSYYNYFSDKFYRDYDDEVCIDDSIQYIRNQRLIKIVKEEDLVYKAIEKLGLENTFNKKLRQCFKTGEIPLGLHFECIEWKAQSHLQKYDVITYNALNDAFTECTKSPQDAFNPCKESDKVIMGCVWENECNTQEESGFKTMQILLFATKNIKINKI